MNTNSPLHVSKNRTLAGGLKRIKDPDVGRERDLKVHDLSGICLSSLCMFHCILIPLIAPFLAVQFLENAIAHYSILMSGLALSSYTVLKTRSAKRRTVKILCFFTGWALFIYAELNHETHTLLLQLISAILIIAAHVMGWRERKC